MWNFSLVASKLAYENLLKPSSIAIENFSKDSRVEQVFSCAKELMAFSISESCQKALTVAKKPKNLATIAAVTGLALFVFVSCMGIKLALSLQEKDGVLKRLEDQKADQVLGTSEDQILDAVLGDLVKVLEEDKIQKILDEALDEFEEV
jgi:hypothetical protein